MIERLLTSLMILIAFVTFIGSIAYYNLSSLNAMKTNIDAAVVKGIDPIAVRCAYASSSDMMCVAYAASKGSSVK
jgi:hypothetical protein